MSNDKSFNVLDMAENYAAENQIDPSEIFKKNPVSGKVKAEAEGEAPSEPTEEAAKENEQPQAEIAGPGTMKPVRKPWTPDPTLTEGMQEFAPPVTYSKEEIREDDMDKTLKNISDDHALRDSAETMNEMQRKQANIEAAKKRHGIKNFQIPPGQYHASIFAAAGDTNYDRAQEKLDILFNEIKEIHPEFILDWIDPNQQLQMPEVAQLDDSPIESQPVGDLTAPPVAAPRPEDVPEVSDEPDDPKSEGADVKVVIDKTNLPEVAWTEEEIAKIKKSRTVELNIVESAPLEFSEIEDVEGNMIDMVLAPYQRKFNDVTVALPASRYRATFTGLSYPELTDLATSAEMNSIDAERKKWSICFQHIKNQNIGPWEEYKWYIDPDTKKRVQIGINDRAPNNIDPETVHVVTKFEDFLNKTSYLDLEFMIWKILCATAMENEIIAITCHARKDGKECGKTYDWVYNPAELLNMDQIEPAVLEEMKVTGEVNTKDEVMKNYNGSPIHTNNSVKLSSSGMYVVFGHISANTYLNEIFGMTETLNNMIESEDPTSISKGYNILMLRSIKHFLVPREDGKFARISGSENILKVIETLNEVDWQTVFELHNMMTNPYVFKYSIKNLVCPACHNKSSINIENMTQLLFIVAQSLSSVQVVLKRT